MGTHLCVVVFCLLALSAAAPSAAQRTGDCLAKIPDRRVRGNCISIRQCAYFMQILASKTITQSERNLMRENQCNIENQDVQVCCPSTEGLGALIHPLLPKDCGRVKWTRTNETETQIMEFPWLALIEYTKPSNEKLHACGGVLISERYVLTAAHCVANAATSTNRWNISAVRLGEWDTSTNPDCQVSGESSRTECAPPYQDISVEETILHPLYSMDTLSQTNDIALIRLREPAQLSDYVQPICLPSKQFRADELEGLVTEVGGWQAKTSSKMRKSQVIITSIEECQRKYNLHGVSITASQLCGAASAKECHGNSGGPLMLYKNEAYLLGGLLSFGPVPCPSPDWPDVFTRVGSYIEWIHTQLRA